MLFLYWEQSYSKPNLKECVVLALIFALYTVFLLLIKLQFWELFSSIFKVNEHKNP